MRWCFLILLFPVLAQADFSDLFKYTPKDHLNLFDREHERFVVANLYSLTLRVYERVCQKDNSCTNSMILQAPMIIGRDNLKERTITGSYRIKKWDKLYHDKKNQFPSWGSHPLPDTGSPRRYWNDQGSNGWYVAELDDQPDTQWLTGSIGTVGDGENFIKPYLDGNTLKNVLPETSGQVRVSNETILFIRNFLKDDSYVFKIYAKEDLSNQSLSSYQGVQGLSNWIYSFNKGYDQGYFGLGSSDQGDSIAHGIMFYTSYPSYTRGFTNPYKIDQKDFKGKFMIDAGIVVDYETPASIQEKGRAFPDSFSIKTKKH